MNVETDGDQATIWESMKATINLGDYNSVSVEFGQARKCHNNQTVIDEAMKMMHNHNKKLFLKRLQEMEDLNALINR